jgi:hypothetical protein
MQGKYGIICDAIRHHRPLLARRRGVWMTLWPYALGWRDGHPHLLACPVGDRPVSLCLPLVELSDVRPTDGPWLTGPAVPSVDKELDVIDLMATTLVPLPQPRTLREKRRAAARAASPLPAGRHAATAPHGWMP